MARLFSNGVNQEDLIDLILTIKTKINAVNAKLDADSAITDTDYAETLDVSIPTGIDTSVPKAIQHQGLITTFFQDVITNFNAVLTKIDADEGVGIDDDYNSTLALTDVVGNEKLDGILNNGQYQGCIVNLLNAFITNWNLFLAKLDADPLGDSDYASLHAITDTVVEAGTVSRL